MNSTLQALFRMFYPLSPSEQRRWAGILGLTHADYLSALEGEAHARGLRQETHEGFVAWSDAQGRRLLLLFRLYNPGDLAAVRQVYETIAAHPSPLAYAFVQQLPDGEGTWDIFHMSKLSYLAHCNRVSGPGSADGAPDDAGASSGEPR